MKICLVTETFPPEINGVAMTLEKLALGLSHLGHEVSVIRPRQKAEPPPRPEFREIPVAGIPVPGYSELNMGLPVFHKIDRCWEASRPDAVYLATEGPLGIAALLVALVRGILPVSGFHTNFHEYMRHYKLQWMEQIAEQYLRTVHNSTRRTFGPSRDLLDRLGQAGFRNLRLLERGVDTRLFHPDQRSADLRESWGAAEVCPVYLTVGRVASEKNMQLLFRAWERIRDTRPEARLVIVGDGPERGPLEKSWPDAIFTGVQRGAALAAHYASADFFLFPSLTETFGNVVTEALASGLVVLAFDYAAPGKFIRHGENGLIVPFGDETAFLTATNLLTAPDYDWTPMRTAARATGRQLSWESVLQRFAADLGEAIAQQKADAQIQV